MKMKVFTCGLMVLLVLSFALGCSSPSSTTSSPPTGATSTTSGNTFQSLANQGQSVFSAKCATCHGTGGQGTSIGPAVWGSGFTVGVYNGTTLFAANGQAMLNFISSSMPLNAPGSLSHSDAINVLCYLLVQENQVTPSSVFVESQLGSLSLK